VPDRSDPEQGSWFFAYEVRIANEGELTVQLLTRHWIITNAEGKTQEVEGPGVVGKQPVLEPGDSFEYASTCPLDTAYGTMHGSYLLVTDAGERFEAEIAPFLLGEPGSVH
jgi:ApaG protein